MFVRTAGERDLAAVHDLLVETWHATYDAIYGASQVDEITIEWHSPAALKAQLARPNSEFLVADDGKRLGGMAFAAATSDAKIVVLHQLYVRPDSQRLGIGKSLLEEVEQCFPDANLLRVEVEEANRPAVDFYLRHGFLILDPVGDSGGLTGLPTLAMQKVLS